MSISIGNPASIFAAQQQSSARRGQAADMTAHNSAAFQRLRDKGIEVKSVDMADAYQSAALKSVDIDGDGVVSDEELTRQANKQGINDLDKVADIRKSLDRDGDGKVSAQEYKDSVSVPQQSMLEIIKDLRDGGFLAKA
jgi:hypothetical protein